jgi:Tfp pilus assembly protein PilX
MNPLKNIRKEAGFVLPTAIIVMFVIALLAFVVLKTTDVQTHQTGHETSGEASFNMAESALDAESIQLQSSWPSTSAWPVCTNASAQATGCPVSAINQAFNSQYAGVSFSGQNVTWNLQVLDDPTIGGTDYSQFYSDSLVGTAANYDQNGDNKLWVRASATINGQTRTVVAQVTRQMQALNLPRNVITAGDVYTSNNGNKVIIDSTDSTSGLSGPVALRCTPQLGPGGTPLPPTEGAYCTGWDQGQGQLSPQGNYLTGYPGMQTLSSFDLNLLRTTAQENGTYYPPGQCPPAGTAGIVFVEDADCVYQANTTWNSQSAPGALIFAAGTVDFQGTLNFYGIIYMANQQVQAPNGGCNLGNINGPVLTVHGNGTLYGGIFVDGCGSVDAGSSAFNVQFDSNAFNGMVAYALPALAKNTFREVASP